jgi:hypothetical protein
MKEVGHFVGEELLQKVVREHESCIISTPEDMSAEPRVR